MSLNLIIHSDLHFTADGIRPDKASNISTIENMHEPIDAIICAGDLTHSGHDGKNVCGLWYYGGKQDQVTPLRTYIKKLEEIAPVYLCDGNHDGYVPWPYCHKGVRDLIEERHKSLLYSWDLHKEGFAKSFHFICLSVYPDKDALKFLKADLKKNTDKYNVIYFHYNIEGRWSDWWTDVEKGAFYETIKDHNVKLIIVGHSHNNYLVKWNGINVASGAGSKVALCTILNDGTITVTEHK